MASITLNSGHTIIFDDEDWPIAMRSSWRYAKHGNKARGDKSYVGGKVDGRNVYFHRLIIGANDGHLVDHINGDTLDNRRCNLRIVNASQNMQNRVKPATGLSSRFKGVWKSGRKWGASIRHEPYKTKYLGTFESERAAAYAYDIASLQYHGEFGKRNFLPLTTERIAHEYD